MTERKRTMSIDLTKQDLDDISIGDVVTVVVVGKVRNLSAGEEPEKDKKGCCSFDGWPPDMNIEVQEVKVTVGNDFSELAND
jgi:hypothetical protein